MPIARPFLAPLTLATLLLASAAQAAPCGGDFADWVTATKAEADKAAARVKALGLPAAILTL